MVTKVCTGCGKELPATNEFFAKLKHGKLGLNSWCKKCFNQYRKGRYKENKEREKEYKKQWENENKEHRKEYKKNTVKKIKKKLRKPKNNMLKKDIIQTTVSEY